MKTMMTRWERFKKMNRTIYKVFGSSALYTLPFWVGPISNMENTKLSPLAYWSMHAAMFIGLLLFLYAMAAFLYSRNQLKGQ